MSFLNPCFPFDWFLCKGDAFENAKEVTFFNMDQLLDGFKLLFVLKYPSRTPNKPLKKLLHGDCPAVCAPERGCNHMLNFPLFAVTQLFLVFSEPLQAAQSLLGERLPVIVVSTIGSP
jgi:hypothetical protein